MSSRKATESSCFVHTTQCIYEEDKKSALERLVRQATFKFRALWSIRDGKGLIVANGGTIHKYQEIVRELLGRLKVTVRSRLKSSSTTRITRYFCSNLIQVMDMFLRILASVSSCALRCADPISESPTKY